MSENSPVSTPGRIRVLMETTEWIAVEKPAGLLVHPSKPGGPRTLRDELHELLAFERAGGARLSIINRLDRETSGIVLVSKTPAAAAGLSSLMKKRAMRKKYAAICWGWPEQDEFVVDEPMLRLGEVQDFVVWLKHGVHPAGKPSRTEFKVLRRFEKETANGSRFALLEASPITGRTHQIRVHLLHAGFPVVGDKLYGVDEQLYLEFIQTGWTAALQDKLLMSRHALHAKSLAWEDPGGVAHEIHSELPKELALFIS